MRQEAPVSGKPIPSKSLHNLLGVDEPQEYLVPSKLEFDLKRGDVFDPRELDPELLPRHGQEFNPPLRRVQTAEPSASKEDNPPRPRRKHGDPVPVPSCHRATMRAGYAGYADTCAYVAKPKSERKFFDPHHTTGNPVLTEDRILPM